jgi:FixJ family two-component response regulator
MGIARDQAPGAETVRALTTVAIVDDDPSVRRALSRLIRSFDLPVQTYASAEEFLASAKPEDVACLLLDVQMEGITGIDLFKLLAAAGKLPPTIVITAHASDRECAQIRESGTVILSKPIESAALVSAVGHALGRDLAWDG